MVICKYVQRFGKILTDNFDKSRSIHTGGVSTARNPSPTKLLLAKAINIIAYI
jgi:hypothetical protein